MVEKIGNSPEQKAFKKEEPVLDLSSLQDDIRGGSSASFLNEERDVVASSTNNVTAKKKKGGPKSKYTPTTEAEKDKLTAAAVTAIQEGLEKNRKESDAEDFESLVKENIPKDEDVIFNIDSEEDIDPVILFSELSDDAQKLLQDRMVAEDKAIFKPGNFLLPDVIAILQQNGFKEEVDLLAGEASVHDYSKEDAVNDTVFREESKVGATSPFDRDEVNEDVVEPKTESLPADNAEIIDDSTEVAVEADVKTEVNDELQEFNNQLQYYNLSSAALSVINEQNSLSAKKHMLEQLLKDASESKSLPVENVGREEAQVLVEDKEVKPEIEQSAIIRVKDFSPALQSYLHKLAEKGFMTFKEYDEEAIIVGKDLDELKDQELFAAEIERLLAQKVSPHVAENFDKAISLEERDYSEVENFTDSIRNAETFSDIYKIIDTIDYVEGTLGFYTKSQLMHLVGMVERGEQDPTVITRNAGLRAKVYELLRYDVEVTAEDVVQNTETSNDENIIGLEDSLQKVTDEEKASTIENDSDETLQEVVEVKNNDEILGLENALGEITDEEKASTIGNDNDEIFEAVVNNSPDVEISGLSESLDAVSLEEKESSLHNETPQEQTKREFFQVKQTYFEAFRKLKESVKSESLVDKIRNKFGAKESEMQKRFDSVRDLYSAKVLQFVPVLFESRLKQENEKYIDNVCFGDLSSTAQIQLEQLAYARNSSESYDNQSVVSNEDIESLMDGGVISTAEVERLRQLEAPQSIIEDIRAQTWSDVYIAERDTLFEIEASVFDKKNMTIAQKLLSKITKRDTPETVVGKTRWETLIKLS